MRETKFITGVAGTKVYLI